MTGKILGTKERAEREKENLRKSRTDELMATQIQHCHNKTMTNIICNNFSNFNGKNCIYIFMCINWYPFLK